VTAPHRVRSNLVVLALCATASGARAEPTTQTGTSAAGQRAPANAGEAATAEPPAETADAAPTPPAQSAVEPSTTTQPAEPAPATAAGPAAAPANTSATAWQYPPPGAPPLTPPPPLEVEEAEYARRSFELIPQLALVTPFCRAGKASSDTCAGVTSGGAAGLVALWRVAPHFAWGGTLDVTAFQYRPPERLARNRGAAGSVYLGLVARGYFLEEGPLDPYVEASVGGAAAGTAFDEQDGSRYEETGAGPGFQLGFGADFYLGNHLRLGPGLSFTQFTVDKIRRCSSGGDGECVDVPKNEHGYLDSYASLVLRFTIMLGDET